MKLGDLVKVKIIGDDFRLHDLGQLDQFRVHFVGIVKINIRDLDHD